MSAPTTAPAKKKSKLKMPHLLVLILSLLVLMSLMTYIIPAGQFGTDPDQGKKPNVSRAIWGWQYTSTGRVPGINGNADLDICYQDPAGMGENGTEPGTIWCLSIADVWAESIAKAAAAAYPGCLVHRAIVLDVGGIEIWIASIADVWTQEQAEEVQRQFAALGVAGAVHNIRVLG